MSSDPGAPPTAEEPAAHQFLARKTPATQWTWNSKSGDSAEPEHGGESAEGTPDKGNKQGRSKKGRKQKNKKTQLEKSLTSLFGLKPRPGFYCMQPVKELVRSKNDPGW